MNLEQVRKKLIELEDVIIRGLCSRANYNQNLVIYEYGRPQFVYDHEFKGSYLDFMFKGIENVHSRAGRYNCFDERPFYKGLEKSQVVRPYDNTVTQSSNINFNPWIKIAYLNFVRELSPSGNDSQYGDTVLSDIYNLQAISKRVHYGVLVMEAKYQQNKEIYDALLREENDIAILSQLKNVEIEQQVLERVRKKTVKNGDIIVKFFKNYIIPMTIQIELEYLFTKN